MCHPGDDEQAVNDGQGEYSPSEEPGSRVRGKRKASTREMPKENVRTKEPPSRPQYCHWLMKSEPDSRFENCIDVKVIVTKLCTLNQGHFIQRCKNNICSLTVWP